MIFSCTMTVQSRNVSGYERCKVSIRLGLPSHNVRLRKLFNHINGGVYHVLWCMVFLGRFEGFQPLFRVFNGVYQLIIISHFLNQLFTVSVSCQHYSWPYNSLLSERTTYLGAARSSKVDGVLSVG